MIIMEMNKDDDSDGFRTCMTKVFTAAQMDACEEERGSE